MICAWPYLHCMALPGHVNTPTFSTEHGPPRCCSMAPPTDVMLPGPSKVWQWLPQKTQTRRALDSARIHLSLHCTYNTIPFPFLVHLSQRLYFGAAPAAQA